MTGCKRCLALSIEADDLYESNVELRIRIGELERDRDLEKMMRKDSDDRATILEDELRAAHAPCVCGATVSARNQNGIWVWPKGHAGYWTEHSCREKE